MFLNEFVRHPILAARFAARRIREIPSKGLPKFRSLKDDGFDRKYGVETSGAVQVVPTSSRNFSHGMRYSAAPEAAIRWGIENCGMLLPFTTFVDIGSGKGRALIVASFYPFGRIVGVEYSPELIRVCFSNLRKLGLTSRCEVLLEDALDFRFPEGDLLIFLYNPFDSVILQQVLKNMASTSGQVRVIQLGPGHETIRNSGSAREICSGDGPTIYEITAPGRCV